jgi:hypothetical protein
MTGTMANLTGGLIVDQRVDRTRDFRHQARRIASGEIAIDR